MFTRPVRLSLVAYTAEALERHISTLPSGQKLPGERDLARQLAVSRTTVRAALRRLEQEGLLHVRQRRRRVLATSGRRSRHTAVERDVVLVSPVPLTKIEPRILILIDALRETLAKEQHQLDVLCRPACYGQKPQRALEDLAASRRPSAWVLLLSTRSMQEWFAARGLSAVIAGTLFEGIRLPAVDRDNPAVVRHAVGKLIAKGHRRLSLLIPDSGVAGDLQCECAFREASMASGADVEPLITRHTGSVTDICANLDRLLARPRPPTGFLVCRPGHALTALGYLIRSGLRFPEQAALISRDNDIFLEHVVPSLARYRMDRIAYARKFARIVVGLTSGDTPPARQLKLMPTFIPGQTLC